jgi:pimeloyl-ACP methyl ester carboxylesterase
LFYNEVDKKSILANRGTDGADDADADINIYYGNAPAEQFHSMVDFITFAQKDPIIHLGNFAVIGHSLGGCLAQMAMQRGSGLELSVFEHLVTAEKEN